MKKIKPPGPIILCMLLLTAFGCKKTAVPEEETTDNNITINIDPSVVYQEMDGFGASDAWSCQYIGKNWPSTKREEIADLLISSHSYYTVWPISDFISYREAVHSKIASVNSSLKYWESEYCILESANTDMEDGWDRDLNMDLALYVGRIIHYALVKGYASSWQWWTAISRYTYKDGLIYLDDGNSKGINGNTYASDEDYCKNDGYIRQSKLLWGLGNYSLFVRPGMKRIYTGSPDILENQSYGLLTTAFINESTKKLVIVIINYSSTAKTVSIHMKSGTMNGNFSTYVTSDKTNLEKTKNIRPEDISILANSITTLVSYYE